MWKNIVGRGRPQGASALHAGYLRLQTHTQSHNYYSTKCTLLLLKAPDITICTFLSSILPLHVSTRVGHLQGAQCQCLAKVIINYNLLKLR
jgi:hypothetical protein